MNITFVISAMSSGGAERVVSSLSNHWVRGGHNVTLITFDSCQSDFYKLHSAVNRISINGLKPSGSVWDGLVANLQRVRRLRKAIKSSEPDSVISFLDATNLIAAISCIGLAMPLIVSERTDPTQGKIGLIRSLLRPLLYQHACDYVVVQTQKVKKKCEKIWPGANIQVIPNPLADDLPPINQLCRKKTVLSVGRLDMGKGHDSLIRAFSKIAFEYPEWTLRIVGDGPYRNHLESMVSDLGLERRIQLPGTIKDIHLEYTSAEMFCLASRYEGFPNALLEALSMGCACISTDCESGPNEILENGRLGILVPVDDISDLSKQMALMIRNESYRNSFQIHSEYIREKFKMDLVANHWLSLAGIQSK